MKLLQKKNTTMLHQLHNIKHVAYIWINMLNKHVLIHKNKHVVTEKNNTLGQAIHQDIYEKGSVRLY
jgi:hypothetical protein